MEMGKSATFIHLNQKKSNNCKKYLDILKTWLMILSEDSQPVEVLSLNW